MSYCPVTMWIESDTILKFREAVKMDEPNITISEKGATITTLPYKPATTQDTPEAKQDRMIKIPLNTATAIQRKMIQCVKDTQAKVQQTIDKSEWNKAYETARKLADLITTVSYLENKFTDKGFENI